MVNVDPQEVNPLAFQPFVTPLVGVDDSTAMLHPDAFEDRATQASSLQCGFCKAKKVGHALFGDFVDVTCAFSISIKAPAPPLAARWFLKE